MIADERLVTVRGAEDGWDHCLVSPESPKDYAAAAFFDRRTVWVRTAAASEFATTYGGTIVGSDSEVDHLDRRWTSTALLDGADGRRRIDELTEMTGRQLVDFSANPRFDQADTVLDLVKAHRGDVELTFYATLNPVDSGSYGGPDEPWFPPPAARHAASAVASAATTVLILDSGVTSLRAGGAPVSKTLRGATDHDAVYATGSSELLDDAGHGTFIAELIAALSPNADVISAAITHPSCRNLIWEIDLYDRLLGGLANQPGAGIDDPVIVNCAFSGHPDRMGGSESTIDLVLRGLLEQHPLMVIVASVGNQGNDDPAMRPAGLSHERLVSVGALARDNLNGPAIAKFSNHGDWVRAWALGDRVTGHFPEGHTSDGVLIAPNGYVSWSGTSFAAAIVSATLATEFGAGCTVAEAIRRL